MRFILPTIFNLIMVTLVELGAVFWVGAQLWQNFVLQMSSEKHATEQATNEQTQARFERWFSLPTLLILLLANIGVLIGQALILTGGNWNQSFSLSVLSNLATGGRFGVFWLTREIVLILAIIVSLYILIRRQRPRLLNALLPLLNLLLGMLLLIAITVSNDAAAGSSNQTTLAIINDWLYLLATAIWPGGILYIAVSYLPILAKQPLAHTSRSLLTLLAYALPLVIGGALIMLITGLFSAAFRLNSSSQITQTAFGRALTVQIVLIVALLITSAIHLFLLRPRLKKEYSKYSYVESRLAPAIAAIAVEAGQTLSAGQEASSDSGTGQPAKRLAQQARLREKRLGNATRRLSTLLRWEPVLAIAVLVCVGLMNVFTGTLIPVATPAQQQPGAKPQPYSATLQTQDNKFSATLEINPNRFGANVFTVTVTNKSTGQTDTNASVTIFTTMLDMDMGTDSVSLLPDGKGHFSASGDLSMGGHWLIRVQIRTPDGTLHEASTRIATPF